MRCYLTWQRNSADGVELRILRWGIHPGHPGGPSALIRVLVRGGQEAQRQEKRCEERSRVLQMDEDRKERNPGASGSRKRPEWTDSPLEPARPIRLLGSELYHNKLMLF